MDIIAAAVFVLATMIGSLAFLGFAADRWGVDSRPTIGDSHAR